MSNDDMSELFNKFSNMVKEGNIPEEMKGILSSLSSNENTNNSSNNTTSSNSDNSSFIDFETLLKMKSIMEKLNSNSNDPRANLLLSLKPYLKESRKEKVDQYATLLNIAQISGLFSNSNNTADKFNTTENKESPK